MLARALLLVAALVAGGWLAVQERAARAERRLTHLAFETRGPIDAADVRSLLAADRRLNPDHRPDLFEGVLLAREGNPRGAVAALRRAVAAEPENVEAWALLASAAARLDPALAARARARVRELAPPVPRPD
jgi:Flp pilus assembly protein TadD